MPPNNNFFNPLHTPDHLSCLNVSLARATHTPNPNQQYQANAYRCESTVGSPSGLPHGIPMVGIWAKYPSRMPAQRGFRQASQSAMDRAAQSACSQLIPNEMTVAIPRGPAQLFFKDGHVTDPLELFFDDGTTWGPQMTREYETSLESGTPPPNMYGRKPLITHMGYGYFCNKPGQYPYLLTIPQITKDEPIFNNIVPFSRKTQGKALSGPQCVPIPGRVPAAGAKSADPAVPGAAQAACQNTPLPEALEN
jgi:hypothetical protein